MKKILLMSPPNMGLYQDIENGLKSLGYDVDCITFLALPDDPYRIVNKERGKRLQIKQFLAKLERKWDAILSSGKYDISYDYLLVINGAYLHPSVVPYFRSINPRIVVICYLYDSTKSYHYERNFRFFDSIWTFDIEDSQKYFIKHLPIYWMPHTSVSTIKYDVFGLGTYKDDRYYLFSRIKKQVEQYGLTHYIKIYLPYPEKSWQNSIKGIIKKILRIKREALDDSIIIRQPISPDDFRELINNSKVIIDTKLEEQDGLTARFMWALGAGKKIITNNSSVVNYDFYNSSRFYILKGLDDDVPLDFLTTPLFTSQEEEGIVAKYRIDNWLKTILDINSNK